MPNIVDLSLCSEAKRTLEQVLSQRGIAFFLRPGSQGAALIDSRKIGWVVKAARRGAPPTGRDPNAFSRTRRVVRRELIRRLAEAYVDAGL